MVHGPRKFVSAAIGSTKTPPRSNRAAGFSNSKTNGIRTWTTPRWCCWPCARFRPTIRKRRDECFQRGLKWMLTFQCKDGGWAAFDKDCTKGVLEKVPFADHNAMLDPGMRRHHRAHSGIARLRRLSPSTIRRCKRRCDYVREHQEEDGSWYGRWGVNYIYGTWQVLRGLRALNIDMNQPWLLKARDWLESVQHEDGGWGERCNTYDDPVFKGQGPSTASQTAWAVMGLCAFDDPNRAEHPARHRISDPHPKPGRLMDRTRNHRHRFPESVLS